MTTIEAPIPTPAKRGGHASFYLLILALIAIGVILAWHFGVLNRKPRIAMVAGESPYFELILAGAREAERQYDVNLTVVRAKGDAQADALRGLVDGPRYDGIAVSPFNPAAEAGILADLARNTTLVTFDSDSPVSNRLCFVGTDNYAAGRLCADQARLAVPDGGEVIILVASLDKENVQRRRQGVIDELLDRPFEPARPMDPVEDSLKGPRYSVAATLIDAGDPEGVIEKVVQAVKQHPNLKCLIGLNTYSASRLAQALEKAQKVGAIQVIGFDADPQTLAAIEGGKVSATVLQDQFGCGFHTIRILAESARGDRSGLPLFQRRTLPVEVVNKENLAAIRAQLVGERPAIAPPAATRPAS
jgi:ribose transport system substrate-binding protein